MKVAMIMKFWQVLKTGKKFDDNKIIVPFAEDLAGFSSNPLNYFLVGHEIFSVKSWLLRPYPVNLIDCQKVLNYRLSRSRRSRENAFCILAFDWRIFCRPIEVKVENVQKYSLEAIALHSYLQQTHNAYFCSTGFIDSEKEVM